MVYAPAAIPSSSNDPLALETAEYEAGPESVMAAPDRGAWLDASTTMPRTTAVLVPSERMIGPTVVTWPDCGVATTLAELYPERLATTVTGPAGTPAIRK